ncbi:SPOR domain-containing protein [Alteriqipengyuania lutimaris]|uniref:SPOR domain-containing protein n=1 Tax=Alteriqipengyuania lutimaris TaxID=1538146 RepID=A0A395LSL2_9SPHN|nr:SPOR domain-containing protein [Alteriqipengyuania lutimaris]MBB3033433.1 hypothetical protein [Alteriqipengyuania lutimaris]RDS77550.1 hypothetical protein DL238_07970 [Alteriqipengyuania lutimaris]
MVDRDGQNIRDPADREQGDETASVETTDEGQGDSQAPEPEEGTQAEEQHVENTPAMPLESGSDEGGTVAEDRHELYDLDETDGDTEIDEGEEDLVTGDDDLGLVSDDDALPWLESSDYDEVESVDAWRVTGFVVLGLVMLALLVGGIWYFTQRGDSGEPEADGSTIAAPDTPYKERPEDPGGKTFEGTGDMAPAVGEGESREGRLAEKSATPEPIAKADPVEEPAERPSTPAATDNRIAVQVGAYRDEATAREGWRQLNRQTDALSGVEYRIVRGEADIGTVYRLQALPGNMSAARRLASALEADGVASQIKR